MHSLMENILVILSPTTLSILIFVNHSFVNMVSIFLLMVLGSHWATYGIRNDIFEPEIKLKPGKNIVSLLSVTVGLQV